MKYELKKLKDVCIKITDGSHNPPKGVEISEYLMLSSKNIYDDKITYASPRYLTEEDFSSENKRTQVSNGDVLLTIVGTIGRCAVVENKTLNICLQRSVAVLKPNCEIIESRYLMYVLMQLSSFLNLRARGVAQKGIYLETLRELEIKVPSLLMQQRLIIKLDSAYSEIQKATQHALSNIDNAKSLFKNYLNEIFDVEKSGWKKQTISEISQIKGGKRIPKGSDFSQEKTSYPYLRVTSFNDNGTINQKDLRYLTEETYNQIKNYIINKEDLYISIAGTIGKSGIVPDNLHGANLTENACRLIFKNDVYNKFVYYFTLTPSFYQQAIRQTRTAAQPKLALSRLGEISLNIPDIETQKKLVVLIEAFEVATQSLQNIYKNKITALQELKYSLINEAFNNLETIANE